MSKESLINLEKRHTSIEKVLVAGNRGPCGGVNMALETANQVLDIVNGRENVYTNWDIVNNKPIVENFTSRGLINVKNNWDLMPDNSILIFSAHGVPPSFYEIARKKNLLTIDATCQLVTRVHNLAKKSEEEGKHILYIGIKGHPETDGVLGELKQENKSFIQPGENIDLLDLPKEKETIVYSQTTLSTQELKLTIESLTKKYPGIKIPNRWDICYATDNRQNALDELLNLSDSLLVVGSSHSHNSQELRKKGISKGLPSYSVDLPSEIEDDWFSNGVKILGVTSGASVLESYLEDVLETFRNEQIPVIYLDQVVKEDDKTFKLPQRDIDILKMRYEKN